MCSLAFCKYPLPFVEEDTFNYHIVLFALCTNDLAPQPSHVFLLQDVSQPFAEEFKLQPHRYGLPLQMHKSPESRGNVSIIITIETYHWKRYSHCISLHLLHIFFVSHNKIPYSTLTRWLHMKIHLPSRKHFLTNVHHLISPSFLVGQIFRYFSI